MTRNERWFWSLLVLTMLVGYALSILQIYAAIGMGPDQIMNHYRGNEEQLLYGLSFKDLARLSHIHVTGMALLFFPGAFLVARYVAIADRWKRTVLLSGFGGILLDVGSWWGLVYVGSGILPILFAGGVLFGLGMVGASLLALKWMWFSKVQK